MTGKERAGPVPRQRARALVVLGTRWLVEPVLRARVELDPDVVARRLHLLLDLAREAQVLELVVLGVLREHGGRGSVGLVRADPIEEDEGTHLVGARDAHLPRVPDPEAPRADRDAGNLLPQIAHGLVDHPRQRLLVVQLAL